MSSAFGEVPPGSNSTSIDTAEFQRLQMENEILLNMNGCTGPREYARYANGHRDIYFRFGAPENMWTAVRYYEKALAGHNKDDALRSWITCSRLGLYKYEYDQGRFDREQLFKELEVAIEGARRLPLWEHRRRNGDLWWLLATRASARNDAVKEIAVQGGETLREERHLKLVGGLAVDSVATVPEIIPEPESETDWPLAFRHEYGLEA